MTRAFMRTFKAADWSTEAEAEGLAAGILPAPPPLLARMVAVLLDRKLSAKVEPHRRRFDLFASVARRSPSPKVFPLYANAMRQADGGLRGLLVELLPRMNNVEAHAILADVAGDARPDVRLAAAGVLAQVAGPRAVDALARAVAGSDYAGRAEVLQAIVPKVMHRAIPLCAAVVAHGTAAERALALQLLGDRRLMAKDLQAAAAVCGLAVRDASQVVSGQAVRSLAALVPEEGFWQAAGAYADSGHPALRRAFVEALAGYDSPQTLQHLSRVLRTGSTAMRLAAIDALGKLAGESALSLLTEAVQDRSLSVKTRAAEALAELSRSGRVDLARTVVWLLRSREADVRRVAVELARTGGDARSGLVPKLLRLLRDEDWWVRERVTDALAEIAGTRLTKHLIAYLTDPSDVVRRYAVGALRRVKDVRSASALARVAMGDADWWVREEAVAALADLGDPRVVPYLIRLLKKDPELRWATVTALHRLGAPDAADDLLPLMVAGDSTLRLAIVLYLAAYGKKEHADWLLARKDDPDARVRAVVADVALRHQVTRGDRSELMAVAGLSLDAMLTQVETSGADDLLLSPGRPPYLKILGQIKPLADAPIQVEGIHHMLATVLSAPQRKDLAERREVDCSYEVRGTPLRFRVNCFHQLAGPSAVFRLVRNLIPHIDKLGLPPVVKTFGHLKNGLVLVGGPTGAGKSTTLAALIDYINRTSDRHIVTIEDPIEVVHTPKMSLVTQRESGTHTASFARALRSTLRQDPDVLLVGELRDLETIAFAVTAAETGHLVFGTVHTVSADHSIDRMLHTFPPAQRPQVRTMLSESLRAVLCQYLLRRRDQPGQRVLAAELMLNNDAIANLIRKDKAYQIPQVIATHREQGMLSMDTSLAALVREGLVDADEALAKAQDKKQFELATASATTDAAPGRAAN